MNLWPLTHPGVTALWTIVAIAAVSIFFYQAAPIAALLFVLWWLWRRGQPQAAP